ncbi:50S ribosome-binding GTPase [Streptomyces uncialis]|uniref:GTPase n=1 Tax=Streptomyces uncialis TaxID=1048205 RepID=UPI002E32A65E|nr:GTPase [Streptomyces uncialis]
MSAAPTVRAVIARHCRELLADPLLHGDPTLRDIAAQCHQPLRVLLVGNVSTGKSTLLNALIAGPLAATAFEETTSSVRHLVPRSGADRPGAPRSGAPVRHHRLPARGPGDAR